MQRRTFLAGSAALLATTYRFPDAAAEQEKERPVIGYLSSGSSGTGATYLGAFRQGLKEAGYVEGQNVVIEYRWAEGRYDQLPALAADLVGRKVDVIVTQGGTTVALAAKNAASTIPIVFIIGGDPVGDGLVASLARPGGNLTGATIITVELMPKRFELLSELVPRAGAIALLVNPKNSLSERMIQDVEAAARAKAIRQLMLLLGSALTAGRPLRAQQKPRPVIGFLSVGSSSAPSNLAAFHDALRETG